MGAWTRMGVVLSFSILVFSGEDLENEVSGALKLVAQGTSGVWLVVFRDEMEEECIKERLPEGRARPSRASGWL